MASDDVQRLRDYVRRVDGEPWADDVPAEEIAVLVASSKARLRLHGRTRGWLGEVHAILKREREAGSRVD